MRWLPTSLLLLAACNQSQQNSGPLFAADPNRPLDLRAELALDEVALLDEVELQIDLYRDAGVEVEFDPALPEGVQGEVIAEDERPWADGMWQHYTLRFWPTQLGELIIPPFRASADGVEETVSTPEFSLTVLSLLGDHGGDLEAPGPLFVVRPDVLIWVLAISGGLLLVALFILWLRRKPSTGAAAQGIPLPAHTKALRALSRLRGEPRETDPQIERFYRKVSAVLRAYLEDRYGLHAPERTTEEFLPEVEQSGVLATSQQQHLSQFLQRCDLVKFARILPGEEVHAETFDFAERLVEHTRADRQGLRS